VNGQPRAVISDNRSTAVVLAPDVDVGLLVDRRTIGERLAIEIGNHRPRLGTHNRAVVAAKRHTEYPAKLARPVLQHVRDQLLEGQLALAQCHDVGATRKILVEVVGRVGPADHHDATGAASGGDDSQHPSTRHQIAVDADDRRPLALQEGLELVESSKGCIEDAAVNTVRLEMRIDVQQSQGWVRLHHRQLVRVLVQEVAVGEQDVHRVSPSPLRPGRG